MLPENDRWSETRSQLLAQMDVSMGGRVAEEIIFGPENITTGISQHRFIFLLWIAQLTYYFSPLQALQVTSTAPQRSPN